MTVATVGDTGMEMGGDSYGLFGGTTPNSGWARCYLGDRG
jgi:hypothetical protein